MARPKGSSNWTRDQLLRMLDIMRVVLPQGKDDWDIVAERYRRAAQAEGWIVRDVHAIRLKFNQLNAMKKPTGVGELPTPTRKAKEVQDLIEGENGSLTSGASGLRAESSLSQSAPTESTGTQQLGSDGDMNSDDDENEVAPHALNDSGNNRDHAARESQPAACIARSSSARTSPFHHHESPRRKRRRTNDAFDTRQLLEYAANSEVLETQVQAVLDSVKELRTELRTGLQSLQNSVMMIAMGARIREHSD